jgi:hypothetical protein
LDLASHPESTPKVTPELAFFIGVRTKTQKPGKTYVFRVA